MTSRSRSQCGQALAELAMVLGLLALALVGLLQIAKIGAAQIRCEWAARRTAWLRNIFNNADLNSGYRKQRQELLPGVSEPQCLGGSREQGFAYALTYTVPALGFMRPLRPKGFSVRAESSVIAFNPRPQLSGPNRENEDAARQWLTQKQQTP